jgi:hypothetical protein
MARCKSGIAGCRILVVLKRAFCAPVEVAEGAVVDFLSKPPASNLKPLEHAHFGTAEFP